MATAVHHTTDLVIRRIFDAPRERVWEAWTRPEQVKKWHGPEGFFAPHASIDLRPGGKYLFCMRGPGPDGVTRDYWSTGTYREIVPLERLVCTDSFADESGNVVPASYYGMGTDIPLEMLVTVTFEDVGRRTGMTIRHAGLPEGTMQDLTRQGWNSSLDKLARSMET